MHKSTQITYTFLSFLLSTLGTILPDAFGMHAWFDPEIEVTEVPAVLKIVLFQCLQLHIANGLALGIGSGLG